MNLMRDSKEKSIIKIKVFKLESEMLITIFI